MPHSTEFTLLSELLKDFQLPFTLLHSSADLESLFSGFLQPLNTDKPINYANSFLEFTNQCCPETIYRIQNFCLHFLLFQLPDTETTTYLSIGPYLVSGIPYLDQFDAPDDTPNDIPTIDDKALLKMVSVFVRHMYHRSSNVSIQNLKIPDTCDIRSVTQNLPLLSSDDPLLTIRMVEQYYHNEYELMKLVSQGQWHTAEAFSNTFFKQENFYRHLPGDNPLEWQKIQCFDLNTLLRKSAESSDVHPLHIENLYSQFIAKISQVQSEKDIPSLQREIVRKYCQLVQIHSLKGYSPLIQKVLTHITSNLAGDLTLNAQANLLNVNPSYLSALFKKETGSTLTEYVKQKRINFAVFLLTTSNWQIQVIAEMCGIADVNYFTKVFKKIIGKTPKEYRDSLLM